MMFAMMNIFSLAVNACGTYGYGTIGSYLLGSVLQQYSVYAAADVRVQVIRQPNGTYLVNPQTYNIQCALTSGNNLTLLAYNAYPTAVTPLSAGQNYIVDCIATWTVAYNAHLKVGATLNGYYKNPDAKSPMSGGVDFSFAYDYSSNASAYSGFYCTAMASPFAGN